MEMVCSKSEDVRTFCRDESNSNDDQRVKRTKTPTMLVEVFLRALVELLL